MSPSFFRRYVVFLECAEEALWLFASRLRVEHCLSTAGKDMHVLQVVTFERALPACEHPAYAVLTQSDYWLEAQRTWRRLSLDLCRDGSILRSALLPALNCAAWQQCIKCLKAKSLTQ